MKKVTHLKKKRIFCQIILHENKEKSMSIYTKLNFILKNKKMGRKANLFQKNGRYMYLKSEKKNLVMPVKDNVDYRDIEIKCLHSFKYAGQHHPILTV